MPDAAEDARVTDQQGPRHTGDEPADETPVSAGGRSPDAPRTRHRRRRAPGDPTTTGSIPIVRTEAGLPDPTVEYRRPDRSPNPYLEIRYAQAEVPQVAMEQRFVEPSSAVAEPTPTRPSASAGLAAPAAPAPSRSAPTRPAPTPPAPTPPAPSYAAPSRSTPGFAAPSRTVPSPAVPAPQAPAPPAPAPPAPSHPAPSHSAPSYAAPTEPVRHQMPEARPQAVTETPTVEVPSSSVEPLSLDKTAGLTTEALPTSRAGSPADVTPTEPNQPRLSATELAGSSFDVLDRTAEPTAPTTAAAPAGPPPGILDDGAAPAGMPAPHKRRKAIFAVLVVVVLLAVVGVIGLRQLGVFDSRKDFDSTTGGAPALVEIPDQASLRDFGRILADAGVVGSQRAFVDAADGQALKGGFYTLPTGISASAAVEKMQDGDEYRVGRVVIPEGLQLDSKKGIDDKVTPGIFQLLADTTSVKADGKTYGVTVEQLQHAAADDSVAELGIPDWAAPAAAKLSGDHRRIEGLIAPGAWEDIDPRMDARALLHSLITRSVARFESWGLLSENQSGLMPYDSLIVASIVEREVSQPDDYAKVARVILNRLDKGQKLEMDSTANYTAAVTNIDVHGETYTDKTEWNTYQKEGLPVTPIGAVGENALHAVENPAQGDWLYFVTVDKQGTTLFARTFDKHKKNREIACKNKFITTGCS